MKECGYAGLRGIRGSTEGCCTVRLGPATPIRLLARNPPLHSSPFRCLDFCSLVLLLAGGKHCLASRAAHLCKAHSLGFVRGNGVVAMWARGGQGRLNFFQIDFAGHGITGFYSTGKTLKEHFFLPLSGLPDRCSFVMRAGADDQIRWASYRRYLSPLPGS